MGAIIESKANVRGLAELGQALEQMGAAIEKRVLGRAVKAAAVHVLELAKQKAPRGTGARTNSRGQSIGHMADSLIAVQKKTKLGEVKDTVGSATHGPLLHLLEFGTAPHRQPRSRRQHPGASAKPFLRPAIDEGGGKAIEIFAEKVEAGVRIETARAARRLKK